jgi:hypothetical protein
MVEASMTLRRQMPGSKNANVPYASASDCLLKKHYAVAYFKIN